MKEELEKELINSLEIVKEYISKSTEFASAQAPLVVEELIRFNLWYSGALIALSLFFILLWIWGLIAITCDWIEDADVREIVMIGGFIVLFTPSIVVILIKAKTFIMCLTAPRLFVIEYLEGMM